MTSATAEHLTAWLIRQGEVNIESGGKCCVGRMGQWVFLPHSGHAHAFSAGARILSVDFTIQWPDGRQLFAEQTARMARATDFPRLSIAARSLLAILRTHFPGLDMLRVSERMDLTTYLAIQKHLTDWVSAYVAAMDVLGAQAVRLTGVDERMVEALRLLNTQPLHQPLKEPVLARRLGLSVSQLNRVFVTTYSMTPRDCAQGRRLTAARHLLRHTRRPIKQLAYELGFKQSSHFARWFRTQTGVYPKAYRG